jgi:transposase
MSLKAYKYRIEANKATTEKLQWVLDGARELYNAALCERRDAYDVHVKRHPGYYDDETRKRLTHELTVDYYGQKRNLVEIKDELRPDYADIASHVLQDVIMRVKRTYDRFFDRVKNGQKLGYPRFKGRNQYDSFTIPIMLARKKKDSHRRKKAAKILAKQHRKVRNQRRDFHHKASRKLVDRYQVIAFEDLQVKNLTAAPKPKQDAATGQYLPNGAAAKAGLTKSILDAGWSTFTGIVVAKAASAGRTVVFVNPSKTSQICPKCGTIRKKTLDERWHSCECGCELDRDTASAKVILDLGRKHLLGGTRPTSATA